MPFGLTNACSTFSRFISEVTSGIDNIFVFLDDILIATATEEEHWETLRVLFSRLREFGLVINVNKCEFGVDRVDFLGHSVSPDGIRPLPAKVEVIANYPRPGNTKQLRSFLGLVCYYHRFVKGCATILKPLYDIANQSSNKRQRIVWSESALLAFERIKSELSDNAILSHPVHDADLSLVVDASQVGMGAVLQQKCDGEWTPLGFYSKTLNPTQQTYSAFDRELLGAYSAIKHFHVQLKGRKFQLVTDNDGLVKALQNPTERLVPRQSR